MTTFGLPPYPPCRKKTGGQLSLQMAFGFLVLLI